MDEYCFYQLKECVTIITTIHDNIGATGLVSEEITAILMVRIKCHR